ncbi:MAG: AAA family ATPase [Deltaproteobacteria bacterium]|nr:AAA family ATPase [Deltaproteobacteria bacterium]
MSRAPAGGLPVSRIADLALIDPTRRWLIDGLWSQAAVGIIGGPPKAAKSWMALDMAVSVASDTPCLGAFDVLQPGRALLFMAEDADADVRARVAGICRHRGLDIQHLDLHLITANSLRLDLERDRRALSDVVSDLAPRLLLLDPFVRLHRGDENDAGHISGLLAYLRELQREHHLAVVVVHHTRKNGGGAVLGQTLRGSGDFHAWVDSSLYLRRKRDALTLSIEHRSAPAPDPLRLMLAGDDVTGDLHLEIGGDDGSDDAPDRDLAADVLEALAERPRTRTDLRAQLRVRNERLGSVLEELRHAGRIRRDAGVWIRVPVPAP